MKLLTLFSGGVACLLFSLPIKAQGTGRIDCARDGGYVYLYSSMITLDVRTTLQCGEVVRITGRSDDFYSVRTSAGEAGYVPLASVFLLKDQPGTGLPTPAAKPSARERTHYDEPRTEVASPVHGGTAGFALANNAPIRVRLSKTISSASSHVGDAVEFEVVEDVIVEAVRVLPAGSSVSGVIAEADPKKRFGHGGKLAFSITSITLADGEQVKVRCYQEASGSSNTSADAVLPLSSGKDVSIPKDVEFTVLVDGETRLKREEFENPKAPSVPKPQSAGSKSQPAQ